MSLPIFSTTRQTTLLCLLFRWNEGMKRRNSKKEKEGGTWQESGATDRWTQQVSGNQNKKRQQNRGTQRIASSLSERYLLRHDLHLLLRHLQSLGTDSFLPLTHKHLHREGLR
mmetsp:Transcript_56146/g.109926  ORF Transcript_56146/g.109926 Transcript_56146/m.109926 type:complete len:113 (-) Transcript_56146:856-1194(-)